MMSSMSELCSGLDFIRMTTQYLTKCDTIEFNKSAVLWTTVVNLKYLQLELVLFFSHF